MTAPQLPLLEVAGLTRHFGGLAALDRVSFTVGRGEVVGLIGPNGSGKTTLLNVVSGRISPHAGTMRFAGRDITDRTPEAVCQAGIAGTFQLARIPDALDARDNVAVAAMYAAAASTSPPPAPRPSGCSPASASKASHPPTATPCPTST